MLRAIDRFETFLRLDRLTTHSGRMRARAVYMMGLAFILTQIVNQFGMFASYGYVTVDHLISILACCLVVSTILYLRNSVRFPVFAAIYSLLIVAAVSASALNENTGINSALLPFFVLGIVANGFICGWRATLGFGLATFATVWMLYFVSMNYDYTPIYDVEKFADRNFQRAMQTSLAVCMISFVAGFFSYNMHKAFAELEAGIKTAQDSDAAKTAFLATMSHELFTPMNGIIGMSELLSESDLDDDQRELTGIIQDSGRDLQAIIGNVLLFSQLEADKIEPDHAPFDLRVSVEDALRRHVGDARAKGLRYSYAVAPGLPARLLGDRDRVGQVLCALLDNAVKFTQAGRVDLSVLHSETPEGRLAVILSVTDTGPGIPEADRERIFTRFTQGDGSITRVHGGTGLGLTVARGLARVMGGDIAVRSVSADQATEDTPSGSTFTARFVFDVPEAAALPLAAE